MNLEKFEKIEALLSAIEEQKLLIYENDALMAYYVQLEKDNEEVLKDSEDGSLIYRFKRDVVFPWKSWLMESQIAHAHNLLFYEDRLKLLLSEE